MRVPRRPRDTRPGFHHAWVNATGSWDYFLDEVDRISWVRRLVRTLDRVGWTCVAFCQMSTHVHLVVEVSDGSLPNGMRDLNRDYSCDFNLRHGRAGAFLRKRFGSRRIEDAEDLLGVYCYVVLNPVAEGLCLRPEEWRWSSYRTTLGMSNDFPFVDARSVIAEVGGATALRRLVDGVARKGPERTRPEPRFRTCPEELGSAAMAGKIRVVVAKPGLDGHDRGAKIIARALRDAGMEVIYTGLHQTPEQIVETAIQEDADAVGISILSGAHMTLVPRILELLRENGVEDVVVVVGGTIPDDDAEELRKLGVAGVFGPGAPTTEIVDFVKGAVAA